MQPSQQPELPTLKAILSERRVDLLWRKIDQMARNNSMADILNSTARHEGWSREHHATVLAAVMMLQLAEQNEHVTRLVSMQPPAPVIVHFQPEKVIQMQSALVYAANELEEHNKDYHHHTDAPNIKRLRDLGEETGSVQRPSNIHNIDTPHATMPVDTLDGRGAGC